MELNTISKKSKKLLRLLIKEYQNTSKFSYQSKTINLANILELKNAGCLIIHTGPITETDGPDFFCTLSLTEQGRNFFKIKRVNNWKSFLKFFFTSILLPILTSVATTLLISSLGGS